MVAVPIPCFDTMVGLLVDRSSCKSIPSQNAYSHRSPQFIFSADTRIYLEKVLSSASYLLNVLLRNCTDLAYSAYGLHDICHFLCTVQSAVGVASAQSQEQDVLAEVFIGTKEIVVLPRKMV